MLRSHLSQVNHAEPSSPEDVSHFARAESSRTQRNLVEQPSKMHFSEIVLQITILLVLSTICKL